MSVEAEAFPLGAHAVPDSPFPGLNPFSEHDVAFFFGREAESRVVGANIVASRVTVLYGPSGVGKSSLLRAGVVPLLRRRAEEDLERGEPAPVVVVFPPDYEPESGAAVHSWTKDSRAALVATIRSSYEQLRERSELPPLPQADTLLELLGNWPDEAGHLLLVLDQFEEYLLYTESRGEGTLGFELAEALTTPTIRLHVLFALREDAYTQLLDHFEGELELGNFLRVEHLDHEAAEKAIERPVERYNALANGSSMEPGAGLVEEVLDELVSLGAQRDGGAAEESRIEAPFLQLVMNRLWAEERRLGSRTLRVETLRDRLGGAETVWRTHLGEAVGELEPAEQDLAARIFDHLVTPSGAKIALDYTSLVGYAQRPGAELDPVLDKLSRGHARILRPLPSLPGGRDEPRYEIFHDVLAEGILAWRDRHVQKQEDEQARARAAAEARDRRRARRTKLITGWGLASVLIVLGVAILAGFAIQQRGEARRQEALARSSEGLARSGERVARSHELAARANDEPADPQLGVLLALEALEWQGTPEAETALRQAFGALTVRQPEGSVRELLEGHEGSVLSVAFGRGRVVTASTDGTARLWNSTTGGLIRELNRAEQAHTDAVTSAAFSPGETNRLLATASADGSVWLWNGQSGEPIRELLGHPEGVNSVAFSRDGSHVVTAGEDDVVRVQDVEPRGRPMEIDVGAEATSAAFNPAAERVVVAVGENVRVLDAKTGKPIEQDSKVGADRPLELVGHTDVVSSVAYSPDGGRIVTSSLDGTARVWSAATGSSVTVLEGHTGPVSSAAFSPDGRWIVTASDDETARVWVAATGVELLRLHEHEAAVRSAAFSPDGRSLVTGGDDRLGRIWTAAPDSGVTLPGHDLGVISAAFSPDGNRIVTEGFDKVRLWRREGGLFGFLPEIEIAVGAAFSQDGKRLVTAAWDGTWQFWNSSTLEREGKQGSGSEGTWNVTLSEDDRRVLTAHYGGGTIFDARSGERLVSFRGHGKDVTVWTAAFSPDGTAVVTGGDDRYARVWNAETGKEQLALADEGAVYSTAFSPSGRLILTASETAVRLRSSETGDEIRELGDDGAYSAAFSPDGLFVVTANSDSVVRVWQTATGELLAKLPKQSGTVFGVTFRPNRNEAADADEDPTYDILTAAYNGDARLYECVACLPIGELTERAEERIQEFGREFTSEERARFPLDEDRDG